VSSPIQTEESDELPLELALAFAPLHKRAFGTALGLTMGGLLFLVTAFGATVPGPPEFLYRISNYFPGYTVTWAGAVIGFAWATFAFFVAGWFVAFVRNFVLAASIWVARTRAELAATRDFLDHI
jgi:hypothetical protein